MNIIAIDIGNTNITTALFIDDIESGIEKTSGGSTPSTSLRAGSLTTGGDSAKLAEIFKKFWGKIPVSKSAKDKTKRDGVIVVASVKSEWTENVRRIFKEQLNEKILEIGIGKDVPLPMELDVDEPRKVGVDRIMCAYAAYSVVENAVVVADFGTAVTIDLVSEKGVFLGGTILPGFEACADALNRFAPTLPKLEKVQTPQKPFGRNTTEAINNGLYYSAIGALETITRLYSEHIGTWPQTVITGGGMPIIKESCDFADSFVSDLAVKGIVLTYKKYIEDKA
ncbi:MAG: type III pantothenate kinase [Phycisphaerae bacterium]|jgi:type III pantothenate kinase